MTVAEFDVDTEFVDRLASEGETIRCAAFEDETAGDNMGELLILLLLLLPSLALPTTPEPAFGLLTLEVVDGVLKPSLFSEEKLRLRLCWEPD